MPPDGARSRALRYEKETLARGQWRMVVTELPHGVSVKQVMEEIEALANPKPVSKKEVSQEQRRMKQFILDQVESVRDESDRKSKLRLVIEPRSSRQDENELMAALMVHTSLETRYPVNLTWLGLDGLPETKGIVDILREWGESACARCAGAPSFVSRSARRACISSRAAQGLRQDRRHHQAHPRERGPGRGRKSSARSSSSPKSRPKTSSTCAWASSPSSTASR